MRVDLAAQVYCVCNFGVASVFIIHIQVLSGTVSSALKLTGGSDARATAEFIEYIDKFFDCLNVDNLNEGTRAKKEFQKPYYNKDDPRLKVDFSYNHIISSITVVVK